MAENKSPIESMSDFHDVRYASGIPSLEEVVAAIESEAGHPGMPLQNAPPDDPDGHATYQYGQQQYIRFVLSGKLFAIPLSSALEIGHQPDITPLPNLPDWVVGISNIRGEIVSIVNLAKFFGLPSSSSRSGRQFIVIHNGRIKTGILVDQIVGLLTITQSPDEMQQSPFSDSEITRFTTGVIPYEATSLSVLDTNRLLSSARMNQFT